MRKLLYSCIAGAGLISTHATVWDFELFMSGAQEIPANASTATGGDLRDFNLFTTYDDVDNILTLNLGYGSAHGYQNLVGTYSVSHIHARATATQTASPRLTLDSFHSADGQSGVIGGTVDLDAVTLGGGMSVADFESALVAGETYVNIHTSFAGGGEIRGQLTPVPEPGTYALWASLGLFGFAAVRRWRTQPS